MTDVRERWDEPAEVLHTIIDTVQSKIWTAVPVQVARDGDGHVTSLQPTVKSVQRNPDGTYQHVQLPELHDAPIQYAGGGGITQTMPVKAGDEGMALISARPMDAWHQSGGVQQQVDARMHDLSDPVYVPGLRSTPRKLKGVSNNTAQQRTDDKQSLRDFGAYGMTDLRGQSAQRIDADKVQQQRGGTSQVVDANSIQKVARKILLNC